MAAAFGSAWPIEAKMVAETITDGHKKPIPADALAEFPGLAERLAQVDAGFAAIPSDEEEHYPDPDPEAVAGFGPDGPPSFRQCSTSTTLR